MTIKSFQILNPGWKIIVLTDNDTLKIEGVDIEQVRMPEGWNHIDPAHKCDAMEWKYLFKYGGFFSDFDILWVKPLDEFYERVKDYDTVLNHRNYFTIGFMGSQSGNKFYRDLYFHAFQNYKSSDYQTMGATNIYKLLSHGLFFQPKRGVDFLKLFKQRYPGNKVYNFDFRMIYPWDYHILDKIFESVSNVNNRIVAIHWYGGHPMAKKWEQRLVGPDSANNTFCIEARKVLNDK